MQGFSCKVVFMGIDYVNQAYYMKAGRPMLLKNSTGTEACFGSVFENLFHFDRTLKKSQEKIPCDSKNVSIEFSTDLFLYHLKRVHRTILTGSDMPDVQTGRQSAQVERYQLVAFGEGKRLAVHDSPARIA